MPVVHTSVLKRAKQDKIKRLINRSQKKRMKDAMKKLLRSASKKEAEEQYPKVVSMLVRMAQKRFIHRRVAQRYQQRLALKINKMA